MTLKMNSALRRDSTLLFAAVAIFTAQGAELKLPEMWEYSAPLISPETRDRDPSRAQKDPSVVFYDGKWHVFMTVKLPGRSAIEYCSFDTWENANAASRTILRVSDSDYYCAPQVVYFRPHKKWYLVYQAGMPGSDKMWVAYSTTADISDPGSWTKAKPMLDGGKEDPRKVGGLDYWIVCDEQRAYLFLTSLDGRMWRLWTSLAEFPQNFRDCKLALQAKIFEASHTYRIKGLNQYLTIIEENGRRYYKAYLADRLDGEWTPVADTPERPFAGWNNIRPAAGVEPWTDNVSHGELIREGCDETMTIDPARLRFVFQGMWDKHKTGKKYGQFQWRIGMLTPVSGAAQGWRALPLITNGRVDESWCHVGYGGFAVDGDSLRTECDPRGLGLLVYQKERFGNCQIRVVFRTKEAKSNAGLYVRMADGILDQVNRPGAAFDRNAAGKISEPSMKRMMESAEREEGPWFAVHRGYEVQIMDAGDDLHRTGAIYSLAPSSAVPAKPPGEWRTMVVTLAGERILVDLDGKRVATFDPANVQGLAERKWFEPKREPKRPVAGYLGLQNHDPGDVVWFKEVSVRSLDNAEQR